MKNTYTTTEAAKICGVSRGTFLRWIREGRLKAPSTFGGHHRIESEDLVLLLKTLDMKIPDALSLLPPLPFTPTILIVDDDENIRQLVRRYLTLYLPGASIVESTDGFTAGICFHRHQPDLIILDIRLPGISGDVVCSNIRNFSKGVSPAILAISAFGEEWKTKILKAGANYFLSKPFDKKTFWEALQKTISSLPPEKHQKFKSCLREAA